MKFIVLKQDVDIDRDEVYPYAIAIGGDGGGLAQVVAEFHDLVYAEAACSAMNEMGFAVMSWPALDENGEPLVADGSRYVGKLKD